MTYRLQSTDYYYYPDSDLDKMSADEKKAAKKYLTDELELDEGVDFASNMTKAGAEKLATAELKELKNDISNTYTLTENNTGSNKNVVTDPTFAKGVKITLKKANSWEKNADGKWPDSLEQLASEYSKAYIADITNKYKKATIFEGVPVRRRCVGGRSRGDTVSAFLFGNESQCVHNGMYAGDWNHRFMRILPEKRDDAATDHRQYDPADPAETIYI